ncbi:MAG: hypothetical protein IE926_09295 [Micrococcales bacterium]|nr:hypothetical protein [Micrococcales bacterium]
MDRRPLVTAGLVAFLVLDLVLVVLALRSVTRPADSATAVPAASSTPSATPSPTSSATGSASPTPSGTPSATATATPEVAPAARLLVSGGGTVLWGMDVGTCERPGRVHVSRDGGATWQSHDAPGGTIRVRATSAQDAFVVGADSRCRFRLWNTSDGGGTWSDPRSAVAAWGRDADDATSLHRPGGDPVTPCASGADLVDLVGLQETSAVVACSDGRLLRTTDGGSSWGSILQRDGLAALSFSDTGSGVFAVVTPDCAGVQLTRLTDGAPGTPRCVEEARPRAGQVSLAVGPKTVWLVAGDTVLRSSGQDIARATFAPVGDWPGS